MLAIAYTSASFSPLSTPGSQVGLCSYQNWAFAAVSGSRSQPAATLLPFGWAQTSSLCLWNMAGLCYELNVLLRDALPRLTQFLFLLFLVLLNNSACFFNFLAVDELLGEQENVLLSGALISQGEKHSQFSINHDSNKCWDCLYTVGSEISTSLHVTH